MGDRAFLWWDDVGANSARAGNVRCARMAPVTRRDGKGGGARFAQRQPRHQHLAHA